MQADDLVPDISKMSTEELREMVRAARHRRSVEQPVRAAKAATQEKKASAKRQTSMDKLLRQLSPEQAAALLAQLEDISND